MITAINLVKRFENCTALEKMNAQIENGSIYGLVGTNGSGKSTFLRLLAGVYYPDEGSIEIDGQPVFENTALKDRTYFVSDDLYFFPQSTVNEMAGFLSAFYSGWSKERYEKLCSIFPINPAAKLNTFSKGMQRQAALILALSTGADYLLLDEAFDGLDPVIRGAVRKLLADDVANRSATVIITSHNLRELEDLCDHVGLLHKGTILFSSELDELKLGFCKVQAAFRPAPDIGQIKKSLSIMQLEQRGSLLSMVVRGRSADVLHALEPFQPVFSEALPLNLEEVFIHEMEAIGYDYNHIIF